MFLDSLEFLVSLGVIPFLVAMILLSLGSYGLTRRAFGRRADGGETDLASSIVVRISALHALILALVFAQEIVNLRDITNAANREAVLVGDTFYDLRRYDDAGTRDIRRHLAEYTRTLLYEEWPGLSKDGGLTENAWQAWEQAYGGILSLSPQTPRQEVLQDLMVDHIREISGLRRARENAGLSGVHSLFLVAAVMGVIFTAVCFYTNRPNAQNIVLISIFSAYTGLVIYFIIGFANPYGAPASVGPVGFERIYAGEIRELAPPPD